MPKAVLSVLGLYHVDTTIFDDIQIPAGMNKDDVIDGIIQDCMELEILYPNPDAFRTMVGIWSRRELPTWNRVYNAELAEYNPIENYDRHQSDQRDITRAGTDAATGNNTVSTTEVVEGETTGTGSHVTNGSSSETVEEEISQEVEETGSTSETNTHKYAAFDAGTLNDQTQDVRASSGTNDQTTTGTSTTTTTGTNSETTTDTTSGTSEENKTANTTGSSSNTVNRSENTGETFTSYIHGNIGVTTSQQMLESELALAPKINTINYIVNSFKMRFCILVY